jgi:glutamate synthase (NADPH) small chain
MSNVVFSEAITKKAEKIMNECMGLADPYCQSKCPMSTDVKTYVKLIGEKKYDEAIKVIRDKLFFLIH